MAERGLMVAAVAAMAAAETEVAEDPMVAMVAQAGWRGALEEAGEVDLAKLRLFRQPLLR